MEVDIGVEELPAEDVDLGGKAARNMAVAEVLAYDRPVLRFSQPVVIAVPGARLGEIHP